MDDGLHRFICPKCYVNATSGTWDMATARKYNVGVKDIESILKGYGDFFAQFVCPSCGNTVSGDLLIKKE